MNQTLADQRASDERLPLGDIFFWITAILLLFAALATRGLWGAEGRWAEVAREMLLTGRYFHPTIANQPYFDKPLFSYWLIVLTAPFTGMNEWAVRVPSAICALAALWATRRLGTKLWSPAVGRTAGWLLLTAQAFLFWGRTGAAEMANVAFIMLAVIWYWQRRDLPGFGTYLVFYLLLFTGAQMKGLTAIIVPVLVIFPDLIREKRWRQLFSPAHIGALTVGALFYLLPFIWSAVTRDGYTSSGIALVFRENIQRFFDPFDHIEPFYIYLRHVPVLFLPWSPLLIIALFFAVKNFNMQKWRNAAWTDQWLALALALIFLFFTASGSRRSYYILPILPFCALYCARWMLTWPADRQKLTATTIKALLAVVTLAALTALTAGTFALLTGRAGEFGFLQAIESSVVITWIWVVALILLALAWLPFLIRKTSVLPRITGLNRQTALPLLTVAIVMAGYFNVIQPFLDQYRTEKTFALQIKATGRNAEQIAFFGNYLENVVFYLNQNPANHPILPDSASAYAYLAGGEDRIIILRNIGLPLLLESFPPERHGQAVIEERVWPWQERKADKRRIAWEIPNEQR